MASTEIITAPTATTMHQLLSSCGAVLLKSTSDHGTSFGATSVLGADCVTSPSTICGICRSEFQTPVIECSRCHISVHPACYGMAGTLSVEVQSQWQCSFCEYTISSAPGVCIYCPTSGGILLPAERPKGFICNGSQQQAASSLTDGVVFGHVICAMSLNELRVDWPMRKIVGQVRWNRRRINPCEICGQNTAPSQARCQCFRTNCRRSFHASCAFAAKYHCESRVSAGVTGRVFFCHIHSPWSKQRAAKITGRRPGQRHPSTSLASVSRPTSAAPETISADDGLVHATPGVGIDVDRITTRSFWDLIVAPYFEPTLAGPLAAADLPGLVVPDADNKENQYSQAIVTWPDTNTDSAAVRIVGSIGAEISLLVQQLLVLQRDMTSQSKILRAKLRADTDAAVDLVASEAETVSLYDSLVAAQGTGMGGTMQQVNEDMEADCDVCHSGEVQYGNQIIICDGCNVAVHQRCYKVPLIPDDEWLCWPCRVAFPARPGKTKCALCPFSGGAMLQHHDLFVHARCALFCANEANLDSLTNGDKLVATGACELCHSSDGLLVTCCHVDCGRVFHVSCGTREGLRLLCPTDTHAAEVYCRDHGAAPTLIELASSVCVKRRASDMDFDDSERLAKRRHRNAEPGQADWHSAASMVKLYDTAILCIKSMAPQGRAWRRDSLPPRRLEPFVRMHALLLCLLLHPALTSEQHEALFAVGCNCAKPRGGPDKAASRLYACVGAAVLSSPPLVVALQQLRGIVESRSAQVDASLVCKPSYLLAIYDTIKAHAHMLHAPSRLPGDDMTVFLRDLFLHPSPQPGHGPSSAVPPVVTVGSQAGSEAKLNSCSGSVPSELFCICRAPYDESQLMIACDGVCRGWFHPQCIRLAVCSEHEACFIDQNKGGLHASSEEPWLCRTCADKKYR